ncbi:MAG: ABC transporter permease subunit [Thermoleophilia bacterium]|nr:ABC transporter permease subunit [Thermoleophilia bacterium]
MLVTIRRLLRTERTRLIILSLALAVWFLLILLVVRSSAADVAAQSQAFGSNLGKGFGLGSLITPTAVLTQLLGVSFNHPIVLAIIGAATVALGARACQGELLHGTLDVTLSRSLARWRYLLGYAVVMALATVLLMSVSWGAMVGLERLLHVPGELEAGRAFEACANGAVVFFACGTIALLVSVLLGRRGSAMFVSVGVLVVMYATTFVERVWSNAILQFIAPVSVFHWFDPGAVLSGTGPTAADYAVPSLIAIACTALAAWRFERRDL